MSAAEALRAAHAAGIQLGVDGEYLTLEADVAPPVAVLDALSRHKAGVMALLRPGGNGWSGEDWRAFFDERAGMAEFDQGFDRLDAEMIAFEDCVDRWLTVHLPPVPQHEICLRCGHSVVSNIQTCIAATCSEGKIGRLHPQCAPDWKYGRRWEARSALIWLLRSSGR